VDTIAFVNTPWRCHGRCVPSSPESESDGLKNIKLAHLSGQLDREKKRAESLNEVCRENVVLLQRQTQLYVLVGFIVCL
jgi:hypothetical protein